MTIQSYGKAVGKMDIVARCLWECKMLQPHEGELSMWQHTTVPYLPSQKSHFQQCFPETYWQKHTERPKYPLMAMNEPTVAPRQNCEH